MNFQTEAHGNNAFHDRSNGGQEKKKEYNGIEWCKMEIISTVINYCLI